MFRFTIRDVLWLMVVIAVVTVVGRNWWMSSVTPLALEGYCPVTLVQTHKWQKGDPACQTIHEGHRYHFVSKTELATFLGAPRLFAPAYGGIDPVQLADEKRTSPGYRDHGVTYGGRIYLFDSEETLAKFTDNPDGYIQR